MDPTIYIVDDDDDVREQLQLALAETGFRILAFPRAEPFLEVFDPSKRGCLILDERMPGLTGTEVLARVSRWLTIFQVLLLTGYASVSYAVAAMRTGAYDILEKPFTPQDLLEKTMMAIKSNGRVWDQTREDAENWSAIQSLTPREAEVLNLILEGHSSRSVGQKLDISPRTVDNHRVHIMNKLRARSLGDLGRAVTRAKTIFESKSSPAQLIASFHQL